MNTLSRALKICVVSHNQQLDKGGFLYSFHPIRVAFSLSTEKEQIVGLLHDIVEDTNWTLHDINCERFPEGIIEAIDAITKRSHESVSDYYQRLTKNKLAIIVKIADLKDNSDIKRFELIEQSSHNIKKQKFYLSMITKLEKILLEKKYN